jgi:hypothetical protein
MPAWREDCLNTRQYAFNDPWSPKTWEEYLYHLYGLQKLGVDVCILLQNLTSMQVVDKYYSLGVRYFILGNDDFAREIKNKYPDAILSASITKVLMLEDLKNNDYSMYDEIVLWFWFNRHYYSLKDLPKQYKYCLMPNCGCYYNCKWHDYHWYLDCENSRDAESFEFKCYEYRKDVRNQMVVLPEDLDYFDPYINTYKLIDRTDPTEKIMGDFLAYISENSFLFDSKNHNNVDLQFFLDTGHAHKVEFYDIDTPCEENHNIQDLRLDQQYDNRSWATLENTLKR